MQHHKDSISLQMAFPTELYTADKPEFYPHSEFLLSSLTSIM